MLLSRGDLMSGTNKKLSDLTLQALALQDLTSKILHLSQNNICLDR